MEENIDIRMSNYLTILANPNLQKNFDSKVVNAMQQAVAIYTATTASKYVSDFQKKQRGEEMQEQVNSLFR